MQTTEFDQLMQRYLHNEVTEMERVKMKAWLDVMKAENEADLVWSDEDKQALLKKITTPYIGVEEIVAFRPGQSKIRSLFRSKALKIAAAILLLLTLSYLVWYSSRNDSKVIEVIAGAAMKKAILPDGSIVWLQPGSKLLFTDDQSGTRYNELKGEGLFEVTKDSLHPFIIQHKDIRVRVMGTSFNIKTGEDNLELKVLTGKVNLSSSSDQLGIMVEPNEKVVYNGKHADAKQALNESEKSQLVVNTQYLMSFTSTPLSSVIKKLENKFDVAVKLDNTAIANCRVSVDLTDHSLEASLQMITEILDVSYQLEKNKVILSGKGCNK